MEDKDPVILSETSGFGEQSCFSVWLALLNGAIHKTLTACFLYLHCYPPLPFTHRSIMALRKRGWGAVWRGGRGLIGWKWRVGEGHGKGRKRDRGPQRGVYGDRPMDQTKPPIICRWQVMIVEDCFSGNTIDWLIDLLIEWLINWIPFTIWYDS